jgi:hypothetical protein
VLTTEQSKLPNLVAQLKGLLKLDAMTPEQALGAFLVGNQRVQTDETYKQEVNRSGKSFLELNLSSQPHHHSQLIAVLTPMSALGTPGITVLWSEIIGILKQSNVDAASSITLLAQYDEEGKRYFAGN